MNNNIDSINGQATEGMQTDSEGTETETLTHNVDAEDCGPCLDSPEDAVGRAYHQGVQDGQNFILDEFSR